MSRFGATDETWSVTDRFAAIAACRWSNVTFRVQPHSGHPRVSTFAGPRAGLQIHSGQLRRAATGGILSACYLQVRTEATDPRIRHWANALKPAPQSTNVIESIGVAVVTAATFSTYMWIIITDTSPSTKNELCLYYCLRGRTERLSLQLRLRHWGHCVKAASTKWQLTFTRFVPWSARDLSRAFCFLRGTDESRASAEEPPSERV